MCTVYVCRCGIVVAGGIRVVSIELQLERIHIYLTPMCLGRHFVLFD